MEEEELFVVSLFVVVAFPFECPLFDAFATFFFVMLFFAMIAVAPTDQQRDERDRMRTLCAARVVKKTTRETSFVFCVRFQTHAQREREAPVGPTVIVVQIR